MPEDLLPARPSFGLSNCFAFTRWRIVEGLMFYSEVKPGVARESLASMRDKLEEQKDKGVVRRSGCFGSNAIAGGLLAIQGLVLFPEAGRGYGRPARYRDQAI